jgi:redox-sensitive bicupin YhaK (pirin superfamily)
MMDPRYRDVKRSQIPEVALEGGVKVKIISGQVNGVQGPVQDIVTDPESLVLYGEGDSVSVTAEDEPVRFLLVSGKPIGEPVAWYGPIVMNTPEEIRIAFDEYRRRTFIKHR